MENWVKYKQRKEIKNWERHAKERTQEFFFLDHTSITCGGKTYAICSAPMNICHTKKTLKIVIKSYEKVKSKLPVTPI